MKKALGKMFTPVHIVVLIWPVVLWFWAAYYSQETDLLHHPIEYIFIFFIINTFGIGFLWTQGYTSKNEDNSNVKKMDSDRAGEIVKVYSKILSALLTPQPQMKKYPIDLLPYSKQEIRKALDINITLATALEDSERIMALKVLLGILDRFEVNK